MAQANSAAEIITEENLGNTPSPCPIKKHSSLFYIKSITAFLIGNTVITLGFTTFISPNEFLAAGVYGLAGIFVHYLPQFSFALALFLFSLPPLFWGLKELDKFFVLMTAASVGLQTLLLTLFTGVFSYTNDVLLACLAGGVLSGIGSGIILRGGGASGGMDLLAMILRRKYGISVGTTSMAINITIVALGSLIFGFERGLYTMVVMFVAGKTMNLVVEGISRKRTAFVITKKGDEIGIKLN
ncbi:MAG: YitT family protein, partial [Clostridia bacterium]|nr:YitT family protein [Clostridia bacterium]